MSAAGSPRRAQSCPSMTRSPCRTRPRSSQTCGTPGQGAVVSVHDPVAMPNAAKIKPDLRSARSGPEAAEGAHLVLHLTEWADYRAIAPALLGDVVAQR